MNKFCVIIPVYNSEDTLLDTLSCFDDYLSDEFNLIIIDDGSTDHSPDIITEYANQHSPFVITELLNENISTGAVRNLGLALLPIDCDYVGFCDSDDVYYTENALKLVDQCRECNFDGGVGAYESIVVGVGDLTVHKPHLNATNRFFIKSAAVWMGVYKTAVLKRNDITFFDSKTAEDLSFTFNFLSVTRNICFTDDLIARYQFNRYNKRYGFLSCDQFFDLCQSIYDFILSHCEYDVSLLIDCREALNKFLLNHNIERFERDDPVCLKKRMNDFFSQIDYKIVELTLESELNNGQ